MAAADVAPARPWPITGPDNGARVAQAIGQCSHAREGTSVAKRTARRPEDLGAMGESYFRLAAQDAGLVVNASTDDRAGWDFEVEEANPHDVNFGAHSKPVFRIQVKATGGPSDGVSMTFSSLLSLIRYGGPAFVLLYRFGEAATPSEASLLHMDTATGTELLKALRRRQVAQPTLKAHHAKTTIRFPQASRLSSVGGADLKSALMSALTGSYLSYIEAKSKWLRELEADRWKRHFRVQFEDEASLRAMADSLIGLEGHFRVKSSSYFAPMGIPDKEPELTGEFHPTTAMPHADSIKRVKVRLRTNEYGRTYEFAGQLYVTPMHFPEQFAAMRIHCALFDVVMRIKSHKIEFMPADLGDASLLAPVGEFRGFSAYVREALTSSVTLLEVISHDDTPPLKLQLNHNIGQLPSNFEAVQAILEVLHAKLAAIGLTHETFCPDHLISALGQYSFFLHIDQTFDAALELEFEHKESSTEVADVVIFSVPVPLGSRTVVFFAAFFGHAERASESHVRGKFTRSEYLGEIVVPQGQDSVAATEAHSRRFEDVLRSRGFAVL
jgi:hypothetical protein